MSEKEIADSSGASVMDHERTVIANEPVPHTVLLTQPFYLGQFEVTHGQFRQFVKASGYQTEPERNGLGGWSNFQVEWVRRAQHIWSSPGEWQPKDDEAVCHLTWRDAVAFCEWLSLKEGRSYTLPTEAQWEFACRAGTTEATYAATGETLADIAWTSELLGFAYDVEQHRPRPVGQKRPNAFGLYDMLGNVWEICSDRYAPIPTQAWPRIDPTGPDQGDSHVMRGGAWYRSGAVFARSSRRNFHHDTFADAGIGFRVAIVADAQGQFHPLSQQELAAMNQKRWDRELAALTDEIHAKPDNPEPLTNRARLYIRSGRFEQAVSDFDRLVQLSPDYYWHWFHRGCLLAYLGREVEYREHCRDMLKRFDDSQDVGLLERTTKTALLLPGGGDAQWLSERARKSQPPDSKSWRLALLMGMAEFRAGRPTDAILKLEKCLNAKLPALVAAAEAFLAMAHHQLGHKEEAATALARCRKLIERDLPVAGVEDLGVSTKENWLIAHIAHREAEQMLQKDAEEPKNELKKTN